MGHTILNTLNPEMETCVVFNAENKDHREIHGNLPICARVVSKVILPIFVKKKKKYLVKGFEN